MRKITLLLFFIAFVLVSQAQLIVSENFNYTLGTDLKSNGWVGTGATPSTLNPIKITEPTITYSGYPNSGIGNEITMTTSGEDLNRSFTAITSGTIYFSALINITAAGSGDYFLHLGDVPTGSNFWCRTFVKLDGAKIAFGILNTAGGTTVTSYTPSSYDLNTTYLLVVKLDIATVTASLIVNPALGAEPATGWITNNSGNGAFPAGGITTINLRQGSTTAGVSPALKLDGIRVANTWSALFSTSDTPNVSENSFKAIVSGKMLKIENVNNGTTVEIFSTIGNKVLSTKLENGTIVLNNLPKGMYVVRVGKESQKIML